MTSEPEMPHPLPELLPIPVTCVFNPTDASDGVLDADGDGYTNVEEFLNGTSPINGTFPNYP